MIPILAAFGFQAATAQPIPDATQLSVRFNPKKDSGKPAYTIADCVVVEHCMAFLMQKLLQAGGNPALFAEAKQVPQPNVSGAWLLKVFGTSFGESTPELTFSDRRTCHLRRALAA